MKRQGFTLIELLVVIAIIGILAGLIFASLGSSRGRARDSRRKTEVSTIGRLFAGGGCFLPAAGSGDYDLADIAAEIQATYPQYAQYFTSVPHDPKTGTATQTDYRYIAASTEHCALYANLENVHEPITLPNLSAPQPASGVGVLQGSTVGPNGTTIYFQTSI